MLRVLTCMVMSVTSVVAAPDDLETLRVIGSPSNTQQVLSKNALRAIFGMRLRSWPDGEPIQVFVLRDNHPVHIAFCKRILNIYPHQLRLAWDRQVYSGTGQAPREVVSEEEMRLRVATTPGAIGYLQRVMVNDSVDVLPIQ